MRTVRRSLAFSFAEKYGSYALGLAGMVILARLLTPRDFGIFTVGMAVVALIEVFRDFGVGNYLVQEREMLPVRVRSGFTITLGISLLCSLGLIAGTGAFASFYDEPGLTRLMPLFAANFLLVPFGIPSLALLRRDMAFDTLAAINLFAALVNLGVVVTLALMGFGFMSLGWATLAGGAARTAAALLVRPCFWAFRPSLDEWRRLGAFGAYSTATALVNVLHDWLPQLILGRVLGLAAVGIYGRAITLCQLPDRLVTSALHPVILPALSDKARRDEPLKTAYLLALSHMSAIHWPLLLYLALLAEPIVSLLLGGQWLQVAPLVRIMALATLSLAPAFTPKALLSMWRVCLIPAV